MLPAHVSPAPSHVSPTPAAMLPAHVSPAPSHVSPTPTPPPPPTPRPLRLRVRKAEAGYIGDIAAGTKLYEVTQTQYLGGSAHGWSLGWDTVEPEGELWIGLSPTGRQPPAGEFLVTHYACLEQCEVLDGVGCWGDVAALRGAGVSRALAAARVAGKKTRLDATRRTYAWRFRAGSVYALAAPVAIAAFCGPWASTTLATANTADMPAEMAAQAVLSLVPTKLSKRQRAAAHFDRRVQGVAEERRVHRLVSLKLRAHERLCVANRRAHDLLADAHAVLQRDGNVPASWGNSEHVSSFLNQFSNPANSVSNLKIAATAIISIIWLLEQSFKKS
jgi:hypothetical protein